MSDQRKMQLLAMGTDSMVERIMALESVNAERYDQIEAIRAENARLREALAKYADGLNWTRHHTITKSGEVIFRSAEWLLSCDPKEYAEEALGGEHE